MEDSNILTVELQNIPKNAGEKSTYIFTIPPITSNLGSVSTMNIQFPNIQRNIH